MLTPQRHTCHTHEGNCPLLKFTFVYVFSMHAKHTRMTAIHANITPSFPTVQTDLTRSNTGQTESTTQKVKTMTELTTPLLTIDRSIKAEVNQSGAQSLALHVDTQPTTAAKLG